MMNKELYEIRTKLYFENDQLFRLYVSADERISKLIEDCILQNMYEIGKTEKKILKVCNFTVI